MKFTIVILCPPKYRASGCFWEVAQTVMYGLRALGYEAELTENRNRAGTQHIIFGAHLISGSTPLPPGSILYNLEQVGYGALGQMDELAKRGFVIWDYAKPNVEEWAKRGVKAVHVPVGYVPELTRIPVVKEDIDVLFCGAINEKRKTVLETLAREGFRVNVKDYTAFKENLDAVIARAKVMVNIHFYDSKIFEIVRVGYALANKKCVVSEVSVDDWPELAGAFPVVPYEDVLHECREILKRGTWREIGQAGFEKYSQVKETEILSRVL